MVTYQAGAIGHVMRDAVVSFVEHRARALPADLTAECTDHELDILARNLSCTGGAKCQ